MRLLCNSVYYRAALYATQSFLWASVRPSVCPSVCPSVKRVNCDKTKASSEKSSIMTNRKSPTSFPMSLRWTAYVAPNPQWGPQRRQFFRFPYRKLDFPRRKSATKFLCVKTFSGKVARQSLAYLFVHKWLVGMSPCIWNFGSEWPTRF